MSNKVFVIGVGMTRFERPRIKEWDYPEIGREAAKAALEDAGIPFQSVDAVIASYCYGDSTCGQKAVYGLGLTGVPVFNVNNNCCSGSSALMLGRSLIRGGYNCILCVGFEKMQGGLSEHHPDKVSPVKDMMDCLHSKGVPRGPLMKGMNDITSDTIRMFAYAAREHSEKYGTKPRHYAFIAYKNRRQGSMNPKACLQKPLASEDTVLSKNMLCEPITAPMAAMTADGGAACVLCSQEFMEKNKLQRQAVEIIGQSMCTDLPSSFNSTFANLCMYDMACVATSRCLKEAGLSIKDIDVIELHDCFATNELLTYEALGMCPRGRGKDLVDGAQWIANNEGGELCYIGNRWVVNPSGGLESKGHPIGASGLAQAVELCTQLRGEAGPRQVQRARTGLQHNVGLGGAVVITLYKKQYPVSKL